MMCCVCVCVCVCCVGDPTSEGNTERAAETGGHASHQIPPRERGNTRTISLSLTHSLTLSLSLSLSHSLSHSLSLSIIHSLTHNTVSLSIFLRNVRRSWPGAGAAEDREGVGTGQDEGPAGEGTGQTGRERCSQGQEEAGGV